MFTVNIFRFGCKSGKGRIGQFPVHIYESEELRKQIAPPAGAQSER